MKVLMIWIHLLLNCLHCYIKLKTSNILHIFFGDFNIDLLKVKYFDDIISHGLFPKITLPTRICESSSTLIDNIFTDNIDEVGTSGILLNQISDHQMMFTLV